MKRQLHTGGKAANRDQRVNRAMWGGLAGVAVLSGLDLLARALTRGAAPDLVPGAGLLHTGLLALLPFALLLMVYLGYARMDEYGQRTQQKAAAFGFVVAMIAVMEGYVFSEKRLLTLPGWTSYLVGMGAYTLAVLWLSWDRQRAHHQGQR